MQRARHIAKLMKRALGLVLTAIFVLATALRAGSEGNEYNIKAMFVINFIKYVEWPIENTGNDIRIGIIGKSDILPALKGMTYSRNEKQIIIEEVADDSNELYKILYISKSENGRMEEILKKYKGRGILIISDEHKGKNAAVINLLNVNNKIRFEINMSQAHEQRIRISSKLNELAVSVKP